MTIVFEIEGGIESQFTLSDAEVVRIEGVRFSVALLKQILNDPPPDFYSFRREGENITATRLKERAD